MTKHKATFRLRGILALCASLATISSVLVATPAQAVSVNPTATCSNGSCTMTFEYTGDYYQWTLPANVRTMWFEVYGAQGGRSGGLGGKIAGQFTTIPTTLFVYVGGQGKTGSGLTGGFNGGGLSGTGHGDEGSGGGASDLRSSTLASDRLVVAGGGGGTGGWVGGSGGSGGSTIAGAGSAGQGGPGGGATQLAGGTGGAGYSAGNGAAGTSATGGAGGTGSTAGGGGGGGGYFGGGGGGADGIPSGLDGGGGGGGSSFSSIANTSTISHSQAVRSGNGQVVITYNFAPSLTTFAPASNINNSTTAVFTAAFSQSIQGLEASDFSFSGTASGCTINSITGAGASYSITVGNCSDGTVLLNLAADAVFGATTGPIAIATSSTLTFDRKKPVLTITPPVTPNNSATLAFSVTSDETVTGISASSFTVTGTSCAIGTVSGSAASYTVNITGCSATSTATLTLKANAAIDPAANAGPSAAITSSSVTVDRVVPAVSSIVKGTSSRNDLIVYELTMSESVVDMDSAGADWVVAGTGCKITKLTGSGTSYSLWVTDCADGSKASISLKANSLADAAGNLGPATNAVSPEVQIDDQLPRVSITTDSRATQSTSPTFTVTYSEAVTGVTLDSFSSGGTSKGCKFALTEVTAGVVYKVATTTCSAGTLKLMIPAGSAKDSNGNLGPALPIESATVIIDVDPANSGGASADRPARSLSSLSRGAGMFRPASLSAPKRFNSPNVGAVVALGAGLGLILQRRATRR
jgi:hypothetical protein